ncbi:MAG: ribosome maturation factor RimM [Acidimicrobiales bacterium]
MARLEVGRVVKPHGLSGEVVVKFTSNRPERTWVGARYEVVVADRGASVPRTLEVASIRPFNRLHLVRFLGVEGLEAAEALRGAMLTAEALEDPEALFVHHLIGCEVFDLSGAMKGKVTGIEANPASDLLVVDERAYLPVRFVVETSPGRVVVDAPEGIFE